MISSVDQEHQEDMAAAIETIPAPAVYAALRSRPEGLSPNEAVERLNHCGPNTIKEVGGKPLAVWLLANFIHLMAVLLWVASVVAQTGKSERDRKKGQRSGQKSSGELRKVLPNPSTVESTDDIKMSEVILKLAEPLLQKHGTRLERARGILTLAVTAWNMSMLPETSEEQITESIATRLPKEFLAEDVSVVIKVINMLMERKREHFQGIQRIVINHEVVETEKGWDLNVSSVTVAPKVE